MQMHHAAQLNEGSQNGLISEIDTLVFPTEEGNEPDWLCSTCGFVVES